MRGMLYKPVLILVASFTALIGLIRTQPYHGGELDAFLHPPDACKMPCWQGIRPGETTLDETLSLLNAHPWVKDIVVYEQVYTQGIGFIRWRWSGQQPEIINSQYRGNLFLINSVVQTISIPTSASFGDVWLLLDRPGKGIVSLGGVTRSRQQAVYRASHQAVYEYPQGVLNAQSVLTCPLQPSSFWQAAVNFQLGNNSGGLNFVKNYDLPGWFQTQPVCQ